jgi:hypothetical protein
MWIPETGYAEIYKYVERGVVHYTTHPPEHMKYEIFRGSSASSPVQTRKIPRKTSQYQRLPYLNIIYKVANAYHMNPELVKAIVKVESNYNHRAVSPKGAQGLMQLMPATAKRFGVHDVFDPEENITGGVKFLRYLFNEFGEHNLDLVLAGYNAGEKVVREYGNKVPPYSETQQYIKKVKALYLSHSNHKGTKTKIYKYIDENGVLTFTNIPRVN